MNKLYSAGALAAIIVAVWVAVTVGQKVENLPADGWGQYEAPSFTVSLPEGYLVEELYLHDIRPGLQSAGVRFYVDPKAATGTNLGQDSGVSLEQIPTLSSCNPAAYLDGEHEVTTVVEEGKTFALATSSGAGAGNFYEEWVYVRTDNAGVCPAVRYTLHTTALQNYPEGTVKEYDREALLEEFDKIRLSLQTR